MANSQFAITRFQSALLRIWATALLEVRLNLLSPAPWIMGLVLGALGYLAVRTSTEASSFRLGWALSADLGSLTVVLLLFLAASLAHRPERYDVTELLDSKVVGSEEFIFGRWIGMVAAVLVPVLIQYAVTMLGQKIHSRHAIDFLAYAQSFGRLLPAVLFLSTLSFFLVTVTRVLVLGAGLAGLLWFLYYFGRPEYPSVFRMELTQNRFVFLGLTGALLLGMLLGYRGRRREKRSAVTFGLALLAGLFLTGTGVYAAWAALAVPSKTSALATWRRLSNPQSGRELSRPSLRKEDPLPDFAWVDQHGRRISLAAMRGKPALLLFLQPKDDGLIPLLRRLSRLRRDMAADELQVVGICLSDDLEAVVQAARLAGADLPLVTDWGPLSSGDFDPKQPPSVIGWLLRVQTTPVALLVDRQGREVTRDFPLDEARWEDMKTKLRSELKGDEQEPGPALTAPDGPG